MRGWRGSQTSWRWQEGSTCLCAVISFLLQERIYRHPSLECCDGWDTAQCKGQNSTWHVFPMPGPKCRGMATTSSCCHWPLYSHRPQEWQCHSWGSWWQGLSQGNHNVRNKDSFVSTKQQNLLWSKNTGISLSVMLKDVFFPEPLDLKAVPPASIWLPRRACTNNSQRWNVLLVPLNDFPIHRFCLLQRIMICPLVTFVKTWTLWCQLSNEQLYWWTPQQ